jgi:flagellar hook-associated protein 2
MGTVGLDFGAATSGQGFDVATTVTQIQAASQAIETPWQNQLTALQAQDTVFSTLGTDLGSLSSSIEALTDASGVFSNKEGSSSDPNTISLTSSDPNAAAGSHTIVVNSLATTSSQVTGTIADASDTLSGSLTITVNGSSQEIDVNSGNGNDTLSGLASAINSAGIGVTAEVLTDSSGSRLSLESNTSGAVGQISISSSLTDTTNSNASVAFSQSQTGADAVLTVDNTQITSNSNTVTNAIPGVTFQLLQASPSGSAGVQIEIANDNTDINTAVGNLVSAYNQVVKDISGQVGNNASGSPEPLSGSPVLAQLQNSLSSALFAGSASGSISNLVQLGITVDASGNGTLDLDTDTLDDALNTNFSDVTGFFQNTGSFGVSLLNTVNSLGGDGSPTDLIPLAQSQNSTQEKSLNTDITNENALLATQKTQLTDELNSANQILQAIPSQLNEVNSIFDSLTGFNPNAQD